MARYGRSTPHAPIILRGRSLVPAQLGPQIHLVLQNRRAGRHQTRERVRLLYVRTALVPPVVVVPAPQIHIVLHTTRTRGQVRYGSRTVVARGQLWAAITGVTRDSTGAVLGSCTVHLFRTSDDVKVDTTTSDASGNYSFVRIADATTYYCVAYKAGSPDVAGTTVNTLVAA
jgi:hypothetical protein